MKRIMMSQLETGNPFMFYRDEVNRMNPNKHEGMVYSSNLCTEIMQNMSPTKMIQEIISGDQIVITKQAGDFVVCNLSSVNLGRAVVAEEGTLERLIEVEVRMLDNVIDLNELPVPQATITNQNIVLSVLEHLVGITCLLLKISLGTPKKRRNMPMNYMNKLTI